VSSVENSKKGLEALAKSVEESVATKVKAALNDTITKIQKAVDDSPVGDAIRIAKCGQQAVSASVAAASGTGNCPRSISQTADKPVSLSP
jgi:hypothetical protein